MPAKTVARINRRLVIFTVIGIVLGGAGIHGLHAVMVDRNAGGILERANQAENQGDRAETVRLLSQYLQLRPNDLDVLERYALLLHRPENPPSAARRVSTALERILREDPSRAELRKPLSEAAMSLARYSDAEFHLDELLKTKPDDAELVRLKAAAHAAQAGQSTHREAAELYVAAIALDPSSVDAYAELAALLHADADALVYWDPAARRFLSEGISQTESGRPDEGGTVSNVDRWAARGSAELLALFPPTQKSTTALDAASGLLDNMVTHAQPGWKAYQARARYRQITDDLDGAAADVRRALESPEAKHDADMLLLAAGIKLAQSVAAKSDDPVAAVEHLDRVLEIAEAGTTSSGGDPRFYALLADAELARGLAPETLAAAEQHLRDGLKQTDAQLEEATPDKASLLRQTAVQLRLSLANLLITQGETDPQRSEATEQAVAKTVAEEIGKLREAGCRPELIELIECRTLVLEQDWNRAARRLESLRPQLMSARDMVRQIDLTLGRCYVQLRNPDRRIEVFTRAKNDDPTWVQGRLALAAALSEVGRVNEALAEYQSLAGAEGVAGIPAELARLALRRELQKPAADRNFDALEAAVASAEKASPGDPLVVALRVELLAAQGKYDAADELVTRQADQSPDSVAAWRTTFDVALSRGDQPLEERIATARGRLDDGRQRFGDVAEVWLATAELARVAEPETLRETVDTLMSDAAQLDSEQRTKLLRGLVDVAGRAGDSETAQRVWRSIVSVDPDSLEAWLAIAQDAAEPGSTKDIDEAMLAVRRLEGPNGPNGDYLEAIRLIAGMMPDPQESDDPQRLQDIETARRLLSQAAQRRTFWSAVPRALGVLETLAGNPTAAYEQFRRARDLGDVSTDVIRGLISYHGAENRWDLAAAVIDEAERERPGLFRRGELARLKGVVALKQGDFDRAIEAMSAAGYSDDVEGQLAHASLLFMKYRNMTPAQRQDDAGRKTLEEATASYRRIVDEQPDEPRAWLALVTHLVTIEKLDEARKIVAQAEQKLPAEPASTRLKTLALCYRAVQIPDKSAERMHQAVEAAPEDAALRLDAANYFAVTGDLDEAHRQLAWLLDPQREIPSETLARARRLQAIATAASGRYDDLRRAIASLAPVAGAEIPVADLRAQAALLARRTTLVDRRELIALLEEIQARSIVSPDSTFSNKEKFALAALYQLTNQWAKARPLIEEMIQEQGVNADYTTALIMGSLRDRSPSVDDATLEAEMLTRLDRLKALEPGTMRVALTVAEFEHRFDREAAAGRALTEYLDSLLADDGRGGAKVTAEELLEIRAIASRAEELKLYDAAETSFRRLTEHSPNPNDSLLEAMYLGRRGRYDDALSLIERRPSESASHASALAAVSVVSAGRPEPQHMTRAEAIVNQALQADPASSRTLALLAGLRMAQGRYDESEAIYRRLLVEDPSNISVLNNLAWLLVVMGKDVKGAEKLIDEAIAIAGPLGDLIDTKGVILLALRRPQDTVELLEDEFENGASQNPVLGFHLATAYLELDRLPDARETFAAARELGLGVERLHATEHKAYSELARRIGADVGLPPSKN